jgi:hypothetical protein
MKSKITFALAVLALVAASLACGVERMPDYTDVVPPPNPTATNTPDYSGPCANVFYPFIQGRQWIYQKLTEDPEVATPDPLTSKFGITVAEVSGSQATLDALDLATGATSQTTVDCQEGAITNFPLMTLGSLFGDYLGGDIEIVYVSGIFMPSEAEFAASNWDMQWEGEYTAAGTVNLYAEGEETTVTLSDSPITMTWQNAGQETVTVPAGTFENAYKVTRTTQIQATITLEGLTGQGILTFETTHWFAPYVGLLKTEIVSAKLTTFGLTFPMEVTGSVELFETH